MSVQVTLERQGGHSCVLQPRPALSGGVGPSNQVLEIGVGYRPRDQPNKTLYLKYTIIFHYSDLCDILSILG